MRKGHTLVKAERKWIPGRSLGRPFAPEYYIIERFINSEGGESQQFIAGFSSKKDRDDIFAAMEHLGLCLHRKLPSWVKSKW